jgi:hypothetical protein
VHDRGCSAANLWRVPRNRSARVAALSLTALFAIGAIGAAAAATDQRATSGEWAGWACDPSSILAFQVMPDASVPGDKTPQDAMDAFMATNNMQIRMKHLGIVSESQTAISQTTGPDRYEPGTGDLYVNGGIVARFAAAPVDAGGYRVRSYLICTGKVT